MSRSFTVRGGRNGSQVSVTWTDGILSGDPPTVDLIEVEAELARIHPDDAHSWSRLNEFGGLSSSPILNAEESWRLISSVFDTVAAVEGDAPAAARGASRNSRVAG